MQLGQLSNSQWQRLQQAADDLVAAWERDGEARLETFLPPPSDPLRAYVLHELIKTDLDLRWRHGHAIRLEEYLAHYPELGNVDGMSASLIYEEYRARHLHGDKPTVGSYQGRFPRQFSELRQLAQEGVARHPDRHADHTMVSDPSAATALSFEKLVPVPGYKVLNHLGSGGMGHVWKAEAPGGVEVAVKVVFRPQEHAEAQREREALELIKCLRHPFLLRTQAFWALEDRIVMVMDLADDSLRDRLRECRAAGSDAIPVDELLVYFQEAAEALDFLHANQVQHRDVKPDNVLRIGNHAVLADFGMARVLSGRRLSTATGCGTPPYMAPECWHDKVSPHSDQYSLACSYVEMRLARRIFPSRELRDLMLDHLEHWPNLDPLPIPEQRVLLKALAKEPEQRFASCKEFLTALEQACKHGTMIPTAALPTIPTTHGKEAARRTRWHGMPWLVFGAAILLAIVAVVWAWVVDR